VITHSFFQGSPEWHSHRLQHWNASDAPAMMNVSPYKTRSQLLHELHTGVVPDVDSAKQRLFDDGHRFEALARPLGEAIIGDELYPCVGTKGKFSASFDGMTLGGETLFEHKSLNDELRAVMVEGCTGAELPLVYRVQNEHQLLVSDAERVLFMASKWAGETLVEERHCWYDPDLKLREQIVAAWEQFDRDLAAYEPPAAAAPTPSGKAPETLPALRIEVTGMVTASNLAEFKQTALTAIRNVNRELSTDADFADAEKAVKWCGDVESRLAAAKEHVLSQTASIDALFKTIDDISAEARRVRLELDKLVTRRKFEVKEGIILKAKVAFEVHVNGLKAETEGTWVALPQPDFAGAAKNKRTLASLQDAVDSVLANAKIEADASARRIRANLACLREDGAGHEFLFADKAQLVGKSLDDLRLLVKSRIDAHKAKEAARLEAERERIRAEETAKAQREAAAKVAAAQAAAEAQARKEREAAQVAAPAVVAASKPTGPVFNEPDWFESAHPKSQPIQRTAPVTNEPATLNLTEIGRRLGFAISAAFITDSLGIQPAKTDKAAKLFRESQFPLICAALVEHVTAVSELQAA
jgi:putative phage-type endonuclease